jgi:hypothetical protein
MYVIDAIRQITRMYAVGYSIININYVLLLLLLLLFFYLLLFIIISQVRGHKGLLYVTYLLLLIIL